MMEHFITYLNVNSGALTFLITLVYVVATIFICWANIRSAKATREQVAEQQREFEETNRAFVTVTFEVIKSGLAVLHFQNHGKRTAENVTVRISDAFIENMKDNTDRGYAQKLCQSTFTIGIGQSWYIAVGAIEQRDACDQDFI